MLPALSIAVVSYFGAYAIWGQRGLLQLEDVQAHLGLQQAQLVKQLGGERAPVVRLLGLGASRRRWWRKFRRVRPAFAPAVPSGRSSPR